MKYHQIMFSLGPLTYDLISWSYLAIGFIVNNCYIWTYDQIVINWTICFKTNFKVFVKRVKKESYSLCFSIFIFHKIIITVWLFLSCQISMELSWNKPQIYNMKLTIRTFTIHEQVMSNTWPKITCETIRNWWEIVCFISLSRFLYKDIKWNQDRS